MLSPIEFLMEHRKLILKQYRENDGKAKKPWEGLQKTLPQLPEAMSFNTFKQCMWVSAVLINGLDKVIQKLNQAVRQNTELQDQVADFNSQSMI
jgi:hypothetical protein